MLGSLLQRYDDDAKSAFSNVCQKVRNERDEIRDACYEGLTFTETILYKFTLVKPIAEATSCHW